MVRQALEDAGHETEADVCRNRPGRCGPRLEMRAAYQKGGEVDPPADDGELGSDAALAR
jgi:hypothetical protein